jgi:hypothetical protein
MILIGLEARSRRELRKTTPLPLLVAGADLGPIRLIQPHPNMFLRSLHQQLHNDRTLQSEPQNVEMASIISRVDDRRKCIVAVSLERLNSLFILHLTYTHTDRTSWKHCKRVYYFSR